MHALKIKSASGSPGRTPEGVSVPVRNSPSEAVVEPPNQELQL